MKLYCIMKTEYQKYLGDSLDVVHNLPWISTPLKIIRKFGKLELPGNFGWFFRRIQSAINFYTF